MALSAKDANARVAELEGKLEKANALSIKVSPKGAVQINGLGRFPTTLYRDQMVRLLDYGPEIRNFIQAHQSQLHDKE